MVGSLVKMNRVDRLVIAILCSLVAVLTNGTVARAASQDWRVDDSCAAPSSNPYYYPEGPASFWHTATYSGGPSGTGGVCMMYTSNVLGYINTSYDNDSYWYLPVNPPNTWSGSYGVWAFIPSVHSTTKRATYQYWPYGHAPGLDHPNLLCGVNQLSLFNVYTRLCASTLGNDNQLYFCADASSSCGGFIRLLDATGEASFTKQVASDEFDYCSFRSSGACSTMSNLGLDYSSSVVSDTLRPPPDQLLFQDQSVTSSNAAYILDMQSDGNLVLYSNNAALWASNTYGNPGAYAAMQSDGNLVVYSSTGQPLWASGTWGNPNAFLVVQCDGNVVIYRQDGLAIWATNTWHPGCTF